MPTIVLQIFFVLLLLCCVYSAWFGGKDARLAVGMMVIAVFATRAVTLAFTVRWPLMIVDTGLFAGLLAISLKSQRYWPLWVTGLHGVTVASHIATLLGPPIPYPVYHGIIAVWSIPVLVVMTLGVMLDQKKGDQNGLCHSP